MSNRFFVAQCVPVKDWDDAVSWYSGRDWAKILPEQRLVVDTSREYKSAVDARIAADVCTRAGGYFRPIRL